MSLSEREVAIGELKNSLSGFCMSHEAQIVKGGSGYDTTGFSQSKEVDAQVAKIGTALGIVTPAEADRIIAVQNIRYRPSSSVVDFCDQIKAKLLEMAETE